MLARSNRARRLLERDPARLFPRAFGRHESWWVDPNGRLALRGSFSLRTRGGEFVLAAGGTKRTTAQFTKLVPALAAGNWMALAEVRGAFALAFWDARFEALTLARDRLGQRTLHTREDEDALWFTSEPEAILLTYRPTLDLASAAAYLTRGHALSGRTLAAEVSDVPAAHFVRHQHDRATLSRFWSPLRPEPRIAAGSVVAELRSRLAAAIGQESAEPRGVLLSGGVDSSLVGCLAARNPAPLVGVTMSNGDNGEDVRCAILVAKKIATRHIVVELNAHDATKTLPGLLEAGIPMSAWTSISHHRLLGALADEGLTSALSGMGADELFGGYDRFVDYFYRGRMYARRWRSASDWFQALVRDTARWPNDLFPGIATFFDARARSDLFAEATRRLSPPDDRSFYEECRRMAPEANLISMMGAHEAQHRIPDLLLQTFEPLARSTGIELTYPFLDRDVAHLAASLDIDDHFWFEAGAWWAKRTLRKAARGVVPPPIVMRRRVAYDVPIAKWMRDRDFGRTVIERLAGTNLWKADLLRRGARTSVLRDVRALTRGELKQPGPACDRTWALLTLGAWYDRYVG